MEINLLIFLLLLPSSLAATEEHRIDKIPGIDIPAGLEQYSGHLPVEYGTSFYWFVKSSAKEENIPLVLWLNGGPGCSSIGSGLFTENGPFLMDLVSKEVKVIENPYSWHKIAHMLYLDAPPGTGYSFANIGVNVTNHEQVTSDMYLALKSFFANYTEYSQNDFYIFGQSFGGVYVPILVDKIIDDPDINFQGFAVGGGYHHDFLNYYAYLEFSSATSMLNYRYMERIMSVCCKDLDVKTNSECAIELGRDQRSDLTIACRGIMIAALLEFYGQIEPINYYNVLERCYHDTEDRSTYTSCVLYSRVEQFLDREDVRQALHVDQQAPNPYQLCWVHQRGSEDEMLYDYSSKDIDQSRYYRKYMNLSKKPRMLVYHGDLDWVIPARTGELFSYLVNENQEPYLPAERGGGMSDEDRIDKWVSFLDGYVNTTAYPELGDLTQELALLGNPNIPWTYEDDWGVQLGGYAISFPQNNYTYTTVRGAGHAVPTDKPLVALVLFCKFLRGEDFENLSEFEPGSCSNSMKDMFTEVADNTQACTNAGLLASKAHTLVVITFILLKALQLQ